MQCVPEQLLGVFCEFSNIGNITTSKYAGEYQRGFWRDSIVIFFQDRPGWIEPVCTRSELKDDFQKMVAHFWEQVKQFEKEEDQNFEET
jgi:hypothetical protein